VPRHLGAGLDNDGWNAAPPEHTQFGTQCAPAQSPNGVRQGRPPGIPGHGRDDYRQVQVVRREYDLLARVERTKARRVVIDSLGNLLFASPDDIRFRELMYSLSQRLARRGISLMMTHESTELFRVTQLSEIGMSHLADNVVLLQYLRAESEVKRALLVLKTRASDHHFEIREFKIRPEGIVLGDKFDASQKFD